MKKWNAPAIDELLVSCTEQGKHVQPSFDEIRVDQNGNYWASFQSGTSDVTPVGPIVVPEDGGFVDPDLTPIDAPVVE